MPVLRLLKLHWPDSTVHWWIDSGLAPLLEGDPDLAGVIRFERRRWASPPHWPRIWRGLRWVREFGFDLVIDLQCLARSGIFAWLANGRLLIGLDEPREGARGFYDLIAPRASFHTHAVDWYLGVLRTLGVPVHRNFTWLPQRPSVAAAIREKWQTEAARWIVLQPGARWANKRWPTGHYVELVQKLAARRPGYRFVILGSESDRELGSVVARADPQRCLDLTGITSLPEMVEWIRMSDLMISNDTGPMHVAAALGKPLVAIFGPTEPRRTGPYGQLGGTAQAKLPCVPCLKPRCTYALPLECLRAISPGAILARAEDKLGDL